MRRAAAQNWNPSNVLGAEVAGGTAAQALHGNMR